MWIVEHWNGLEYTRGESSGAALNAAVLKFSPDKRRQVRRGVWEHMKQKGFRLLEQPRSATGDA